jgi:hypothetical protein
MVQMKNRVSGLLMETGVEYNKQRLHKVSYMQVGNPEAIQSEVSVYYVNTYSYRRASIGSRLDA